MVSDDFKLELVKLNFVIFGAGISGIKIGIEYSKVHITVGLCILGATVFMQYLSFLPEFSIVWPSDDEAKIKNNMKILDEWYMVLGSIAYLFLIFGFVIPYGFPDSFIGAALPFLFAFVIFNLRLWLLSHHPSKEVNELDKGIVIGFCVLLALLTVGIVGPN